MNYYERQVQHIVRMWYTPGWKDEARHTAKVLEEDQTGIFAGITEAVRRRIKLFDEQRKNGG